MVKDRDLKYSLTFCSILFTESSEGNNQKQGDGQTDADRQTDTSTHTGNEPDASGGRVAKAKPTRAVRKFAFSNSGSAE